MTSTFEHPTSAFERPGSIAIGGIGGSGTRLVAEIFREMGMHLGGDLNRASDNLWFTLLFKRRGILECTDSEFHLLLETFLAGLSGGSPLAPQVEERLRLICAIARPTHDVDWLCERARSLIVAARRPIFDGWYGWKEPNTHVVIERLLAQLPMLRYVHVARHPLDVAHGRNQNQVRLWGGDHVSANTKVGPVVSLDYWCRTHRRMEALQRLHPDRIFFLNYDALCTQPEQQLVPMLEFLGIPIERLPNVEELIAPTRPLAPWCAIDSFPIEQLEYVQSLGYDISERTLA